MILFFYGQDSYRIKQQVKKLKEKFITASLGDTNLAILDGKIASYDDIVRQILAVPFLSRTRLIIIVNILSEGKKELQEKVGDFLKKVPQSTILLFTEDHPDKRLTLFKKLLKANKVKEFVPLEPEGLKVWIKKEVENRNAEIEPEAIIKLIQYVGNDLWRLSNELDKLIAFNHLVNSQNIELLVQSQIEKDIFRLIDAVAAKNLKKALIETEALISTGENELYILSMIVYQYRNLLILKDLVERSKSGSSWELGKKTGLHPFVVSKTLSQLNNFTLSEIKKGYRTLLDFDIAIKTGKIEKKVALSLLLAKFCV